MRLILYVSSIKCFTDNQLYNIIASKKFDITKFLY